MYETAQRKSRETYNVNKYIKWTLPLLDEFGSVMLLPLFLVFLAKVALECLLAPGTIDGICNRRKRADGFVFARVTEELSNRLNVSKPHYMYM